MRDNDGIIINLNVYFAVIFCSCHRLCR